MSERFTSAVLPGEFGCGIAEYGRKTPEEMVATIRKYAEAEKEKAEKILAAADGDFLIETYVGAVVQRKKEVLQTGKPRP